MSLLCDNECPISQLFKPRSWVCSLTGRKEGVFCIPASSTPGPIQGTFTEAPRVTILRSSVPESSPLPAPFHSPSGDSVLPRGRRKLDPVKTGQLAAQLCCFQEKQFLQASPQAQHGSGEPSERDPTLGTISTQFEPRSHPDSEHRRGT